MGIVTIVFGVIIAALLIGHVALYYTKSKNKVQQSVREGEGLGKTENTFSQPLSMQEKPLGVAENAEVQVLKDKVNMAHSRLDQFERNRMAPDVQYNQFMTGERIHRLENTAENNKIDLIAIKQILQDIQHKMKK